MQQVFQLLHHWTQPVSPRSEQQRIPALLNFQFVTPQHPTPSEENISSTCSIGRAEACLSTAQLSASHCLDEAEQQQSSVVYLQKDARHSDLIHDTLPFRSVRRAPKLRQSSLLEASQVLELGRPNLDAYSQARAQGLSQKNSLKVARRLSKRSHQNELLEKVKDACEKVSVQALVNSPLRYRTPSTQRHSIQIKIG